MTRTAPFLLLLALTGCSLTPTQQKWAGVAASVVVTGALIAHRNDRGGELARTDRSIDPPSCVTTSCK